MGVGLIDEWINQAKDIVESAQDWPFLEKTATLTFQSGERKKALPADFAWPVNVTATKSSVSDRRRRLTQVNPEEEPFNFESEGTVQFFWIEDHELYLWRVPTETYDIRVRYLSIPEPLVDDTDEPSWDRRFHRILVFGALIYVYEFLEMWQEAHVKREEFEALLSRMDFFYNRIRQDLRYGQHATSGRPQRHPFSWEV